MDSRSLKFWVTCPYCRKKFGTSPELVFKYLDRIMPEIEKAPANWSEKMVETTKQGLAKSKG